ncbi:MAG: glycoside hydrolase family 99-like domain-containing protein [Tannerella sp.]|jgi:hypothetical protein|nr:glycoside hydrolase family 99-like domain-containing protein [Tannerella sp.]
MRNIGFVYLVLVSMVLGACNPQKKSDKAKQHYDVAAYIWPAYFNEPRFGDMGVFHDGKGEWEAIYNAKPKFEGHRQPREPLWGYFDESAPEMQEKIIATALDYGVNTFIFDWYWYDDRPFLEDVLNKGFLKAKNNEEMNFYLMWANHTHNSYLDYTNPDKNKIYWEGGVSREIFDRLTDHVIKDYFSRPNYYRIDGKPVFAIYEVSTFINGIGGEQAAREALDAFRKKCVAAGLPGVHIQAILWTILPESLAATPGDKHQTENTLMQKLGFESLTHYQWCHYVPTGQPYLAWGEKAQAQYPDFDKAFTLPYYPHVSISWDPNPRFPEGTYPCVQDATPDQFKQFLLKAKEYVDAHPQQTPLITVNAWNEWAEGSYLEPDTEYQYGFLEAVKEVFK